VSEVEEPVDVEIERPHVHHRPTGIPWYDLAIPVAALFVSFVSIYIAWHHGKVMQELVYQNEKLVEANSLPYLQIDTSDLEPDLRTPTFRLTVQNQGIGPARIAGVIITVNGQPVPNFNTLVDRCCAPGLLDAASRGSKQFRGVRNGEVILSTLHDRMIRPSEALDAFDWRVTAANEPIINRLKQGFASNRINTEICYCSVFDDCWVRTDDDQRPVPVKQCAVPAVAYRQ
jgi:hypothetical protein